MHLRHVNLNTVLSGCGSPALVQQLNACLSFGDFVLDTFAAWLMLAMLRATGIFVDFGDLGLMSRTRWRPRLRIALIFSTAALLFGGIHRVRIRMYLKLTAISHCTWYLFAMSALSTHLRAAGERSQRTSCTQSTLTIPAQVHNMY